MFERGERDQYPPIGKGGHPPLQAFLGAGCRCANTRKHLTQFLLSLFGGAMDVLGDAIRWRFFGSHDLTLSTLVLILQWLLRAASRRPPMRLPRQIRSRKIQVTQTPMFGKPTSDYPVASADPYALGLRSLAPRICSYSVDFRPVPRPRSV